MAKECETNAPLDCHERPDTGNHVAKNEIHLQITREKQMCSIPVLDWVHGLVFTECCVPVVTGGSQAAKKSKDTQVTVGCEACQCVPCGKSKMQLL